MILNLVTKVINLASQIVRGHVRFKYPIYKTMVKVFKVCKHKMGPFLWLYLNTIRQHKVLALYTYM